MRSAGGIGGNNPQQTYESLSSKLLAASAKLDQHKYTDALGKVQDFQIAVITMRDAAKPKLSAQDAGLLLDGADPDRFPIDEGVNGAIGCIGLVGPIRILRPKYAYGYRAMNDRDAIKVMIGFEDRLHRSGRRAASFTAPSDRGR